MAARPAQRGQEQPLDGARLLERTRHDEERACACTRLAARVKQGPGTGRYERILAHTPSATTFRPGDTELQLTKAIHAKAILTTATHIPMASTEVELKPAHASASEITPDSVSAWAGAGLGLARARARAIELRLGLGLCLGLGAADHGEAQHGEVAPDLTMLGFTVVRCAEPQAVARLSSTRRLRA